VEVAICRQNYGTFCPQFPLSLLEVSRIVGDVGASGSTSENFQSRVRKISLHGCVVSSDVVRTAHHVTRHNKPIHNILSTAPQLSISQKALGTLPEDGNVVPKHVGATVRN
jgi:hypothetical protein